ncbi:hypothetical protein DFJ73DRAFT_817097 [Zopfochytrium polystomum]|nr:hypothetical protein DFJ73DRAFT_817097 [Zopfochytrium polystomum]
MRGGSPSALRFPLGQPTPPPPLPTAHPNAVTFPPSPPPPQAQQQQHLSQQLQPQRVNSLDVVVWQLRGGTVKTVRSVLGWVVAAGTGCLVCELVLAVVVEKSGNSLTAYYSWVGQLLINFAFLAGATLVFAVQIYRYARQGSRQQ